MSPVLERHEAHIAKVYDYNIHRNYNVFNDFQKADGETNLNESIKTYTAYDKSVDKMSEIRNLTQSKFIGRNTGRQLEKGKTKSRSPVREKQLSRSRER